jgi:alcohol dehydrogenase
MSGRLQLSRLITHRFRLEQIVKAYDTFGNAAQERALKVLISND